MTLQLRSILSLSQIPEPTLTSFLIFNEVANPASWSSWLSPYLSPLPLLHNHWLRNCVCNWPIQSPPLNLPPMLQKQSFQHKNLVTYIVYVLKFTHTHICMCTCLYTFLLNLSDIYQLLTEKATILELVQMVFKILALRLTSSPVFPDWHSAVDSQICHTLSFTAEFVYTCSSLWNVISWVCFMKSYYVPQRSMQFSLPLCLPSISVPIILYLIFMSAFLDSVL